VAAVALANGLNANLVHKWCAKYPSHQVSEAAPTLLPVKLTRTSAMHDEAVPATPVRLRGEIDETGVRLVLSDLMAAAK
jgi:transposase-like protein